MDKFNRYNLTAAKREPLITVCSQKVNVERDYFESIEQQYLRFRKAGQNAVDYLRNLYGKEAMDEVIQGKDIDESLEELAENTSYKADPMDVADYLRSLDAASRQARSDLQRLYKEAADWKEKNVPKAEPTVQPTGE